MHFNLNLCLQSKNEVEKETAVVLDQNDENEQLNLEFNENKLQESLVDQNTDSNKVTENRQYESKDPILIEIIPAKEPAAKRIKTCKVSDYDLLQAINNDPLGFCVLNRYKSYGFLDTANRSLLLRIILISCLKEYGE